MIAIACDHSALDMKKEVEALLDEMGLALSPITAPIRPTAVTIPYSAPGPRKPWLRGNAKRGIVICGTGIGISLAANKVKGIRCALCSEPYSAELTRAAQRRQYAGAGRPRHWSGTR